jgi:hypothetical protein
VDSGYAVLGTLGFVALVATLVLMMRIAERGVAHLLGLPTFRWFEVRTAPGWSWKRLLVRSASAAAPFACCAALFFIVIAVGGVSEPTTSVEVLDGPARDAGMRDGDKLLSVGSVPVHTWDEARAQIRAHSGPVPISVERSGQRQELSVTPDSGRIGVAPVYAMHRVALAQAAWRAMRLPLTVVIEVAKSFIRLHVSDTELQGPAGIVRETSKAAQTGWLSLLYFLGVLGSYLWPFVAAVHVFDVVTGWTFRMTVTETSPPEHTLRISRLRFSMYFALGCWLAFVLVEMAASAELPGALLLLALLMPGVLALWPLLWISSRELWSKKWPWGVLVPVAFVPCMAQVLGVWVALCLRKEERRLRSLAA